MTALARRCTAAACAAAGAGALLFSSSGRRAAHCADERQSGFHISVTAPAGVKTAAALFLANAAVWGAWQVNSARVQHTLSEWFMTRGSGGGARQPAAAAVARALLSSYSHSSLLHLAANMMGLFSFTPQCMDGRETPRAPKLSQAEFLAMYTAAGVAGGLGSNAFSSRLGTGRPGLGASGSLFAVLSYAVLCYPDSRVLLFFVLEMSSTNALAAATALNVFLCGREYMAARGRCACVWGGGSRPAQLCAPRRACPFSIHSFLHPSARH